MATSVQSRATPAMLVWARKSRGLTLEEVAGAEGIEPARLAKWEAGDGTPTLSQLEKLAKRYKRPLMVFYLSEPPTGFTVVRDFRLLPQVSNRDFSPDLRLAIRSAQERQAWASDYLREHHSPMIPFVGSLTDDAPPESVASAIRNKLGLTLEQQANCSQDSEAFRRWKDSCEKIGVFVFSAPGIDVSEMRGFALADQYAPTVVLNAQDSYRAKSFTLLHELVHIFLGNTAVSGATEAEVAPYSGKPVERFCNRVAAEILVPLPDFTRYVPKDWMSKDDEVIKDLSRRYWVSRPVIALRLVEAGLANREYYQSKMKMWLSTPPKERTESAPIKQYVLALSRRGEAFSKLAVSAFHAGEIHGGELVSLMGMKLNHLSALEAKLFPMRVQRPTG